MKLCVASLIVLISIANLSQAQQSPEQISWQAGDMSLFTDTIQHALMKFKDRQAPYAQYELHEIDKIVDNMVALQNPDGGWPKNVDWLKKYAKADSIGEKYRKSTLDNHNIYSLIIYLSEAHYQTGRKNYRESATRGLNYILENQPASEEWRGSDVDATTFNEDVMTGVLQLLTDVTGNRNLYGYMSDSMINQVRDAYDQDIECILVCQISVNGKLAAWCQQPSHDDYPPIWAKMYSLENSEPIFCTRERKITQDFTEASREHRTGYAWHGYWPG